MNDLEHPEITNALRTGYPHKMPPVPRCPICNEECSTIYIDYYGNAAGCEECIGTADAYEYFDSEE